MYTMTIEAFKKRDTDNESEINGIRLGFASHDTCRLCSNENVEQNQQRGFCSHLCLVQRQFQGFPCLELSSAYPRRLAHRKAWSHDAKFTSQPLYINYLQSQ